MEEASSSVARGVALSEISYINRSLPWLLKLLQEQFQCTITNLETITLIISNTNLYSLNFFILQLFKSQIQLDLASDNYNMEAPQFNLFVQNLQRAINCLTDQDRNIRKSGLQTLLKQLKKSPKQYHERLFENTHLGRNLMHTLRDPIQNNRQLTMNIIDLILKGATQLRREETDLIIKQLVARINATPFPEKSEELREKTIVLLRGCLRFRQSFTSMISEVATALGLCLGDQSAQIKNSTCELINEISKEYRSIVGKHSQGLAKALSENMKNNKYQVRKTSIVTVSRLLVTEGAGSNFQHLQLAMKCSICDAKAEVRKTCFESIGFLLKFMAPKFLRQYESTLVSYLLSGLSDQNLQNSMLCQRLLEQSGASLRELEGEMNGEEVTNEK